MNCLLRVLDPGEISLSTTHSVAVNYDGYFSLLLCGISISAQPCYKKTLRVSLLFLFYWLFKVCFW